MKRFLMGLLVCVLGVLLGVAGYQTALDKGWVPPADLQFVTSTVDDSNLGCEATFKSIEDIRLAQAETITTWQEDSVFRCMTPSTLANVSAVVLKRDGVATITSIVQEYRANSSIYDPIASVTPEVQNNVKGQNGAELPHNKNEGSVTYQMKDTVIGHDTLHILKHS